MSCIVCFNCHHVTNNRVKQANQLKMNGNGKNSGESQIQGKTMYKHLKNLLSNNEISVALGAMLEAAGDRTLLVLEAVNTSLRKIALRHPNEVLLSCCHYYEKNQKLSNENLAIILTPMEDICHDQIVLIDGDTLIVLIDFCLNVMTRHAVYEPNVQLSASAILVALGTKHCVQVIAKYLICF